MDEWVMPRALPLLSAAEMRAAEAAWFAAGHASFSLMEKAGAAVAAAAQRMLPAGGRVLVLAGPGNNGGDGYIAGAMLQQRGFRVAVEALAPPATADAGRAAAGWPAMQPATAADRDGADLIIDSLFGTGLARPLAGPAAALAERANQSGKPILAVDLPSGIDADSGEAPGAAIRATRTLALHVAKPGHYLLPGRLHSGALSIADLGLPAPATKLWANGPGPWAIPVPVLGVHKYKRGGALVWSGPEFMTGAARLAARAALRVGAGAVTLVGDAAALRVHAAHVTAIMLAEADALHFAGLLANPKIRAVCVGPGAGPPALAAATAALASGKALVLDADALTAFAGAADHLIRLIGRSERPVVLTPHEGEFGRLFPDIAGGSRLSRAVRAAQATGAIVVLKGADGCIAAPDGRALVACNTQGWLATAGSGDVLSGMITGLLAQGLDGFAAAGAASWLHGELGARLGLGLTADDLSGRALGELLSALS